MYYIHKFEWEPGSFKQTRLLPGYNSHAEARLMMKHLDDNKPHTSYEIKKEDK